MNNISIIVNPIERKVVVNVSNLQGIQGIKGDAGESDHLLLENIGLLTHDEIEESLNIKVDSDIVSEPIGSIPVRNIVYISKDEHNQAIINETLIATTTYLILQ